MKVAKFIFLDDNYLFIQSFWCWFVKKLIMIIVLCFSMLSFPRLLLIWVWFGGVEQEELVKRYEQNQLQIYWPWILLWHCFWWTPKKQFKIGSFLQLIGIYILQYLYLYKFFLTIYKESKRFSTYFFSFQL